jgi:hypothetical protein
MIGTNARKQWWLQRYTQERPVTVDEHRGLIIVRDEAMIRVLCPNDALELANAVIQTVIRLRRRRAMGPFSSEADI